MVLVRWLALSLRLAGIPPSVDVLDDRLPACPSDSPDDLLVAVIDFLMQRVRGDQRPVAWLERRALAAVRAKDDSSGARDGVDDLLNGHSAVKHCDSTLKGPL